MVPKEWPSERGEGLPESPRPQRKVTHMPWGKGKPRPQWQWSSLLGRCFSPRRPCVLGEFSKRRPMRAAFSGPAPAVFQKEEALQSSVAAAKSLQSCPTLCDPINGSPPGSPVPGILQARTLKWVAISFSSAWKWKVKVKSLNRVRLLATPGTAAYQAPLSMGFSRQEYWSGLPLPSPCFSRVNCIYLSAGMCVFIL